MGNIPLPRLPTLPRRGILGRGSGGSHAAAAAALPPLPPPRRFAWCSLDPTTNELVPYTVKNAQTLEAAYTRGEPQVAISVPVSEMHGLIAYVHFNTPAEGQHTQRTGSGAGERMVRRVESSATEVDFGGGLVFTVPESSFTNFGRVAWVTVEPVEGALQPYTQQNALLLEAAFRSHEKSKHIFIELPMGSLSVMVSFDFKEGNHLQTSGSGLRSVSRVICEHVPREGKPVPLYRRPEDQSIDSLRYRLRPVDDGVTNSQAGMITIPERVFMMETQLDSEAFSPVRVLENAVAELGYSCDTLDDIADRMKEEPLRLASLVIVSEYRVDDEVPLYLLCNRVLSDWAEHNLFGGEGPPAPRSALAGSPDDRPAEPATWLVQRDDVRFQSVLRFLFGSPAADFEEFISSHVLTPMRIGPVLVLRKCAAAAIWRVLMQNTQRQTNPVEEAVDDEAPGGAWGAELPPNAAAAAVVPTRMMPSAD